MRGTGAAARHKALPVGACLPGAPSDSESVSESALSNALTFALVAALAVATRTLVRARRVVDCAFKLSRSGSESQPVWHTAVRARTRACVRVERPTSRAISFRPLRALTPMHRRDWHGLACGKCGAFKYTSPARSKPRRVRCVQSGRRWRWRAAGEVEGPSYERRGCATHSRGLDADGTACFRSVHPAAAVAVRVEHSRISLRRVIHDWQLVAACACMRACEHV